VEALLIQGVSKVSAMADDAEDDIETEDDAEAGEGDGEAGAKKGGLKKLILFVGLPVAILLLGGVAGGLLLFGGGAEEEALAEGEGEAEVSEADAMAASLDRLNATNFEMTVDVEGDGGRTQAMVLNFAVVYEDEEIGRVLEHEAMQERLIDSYIEFLRTLRPEDIYGSMGTFRLRAELLRRTNLEIEPLSAEQVLIKELLIN
jgi:flagellar FliL protein